MRLTVTKLLLVFGLIAFTVAGLAIVDMFLPRPFDGVILESDAPGQLKVREVVPDSGADRAGIQPGTQIVGIDRAILRSPSDAANVLAGHEIGSTIPYLIRDGGVLREVWVQLGPRRIGSPGYFYACLLGFTFFGFGLWVLHRQPRLRAAQIFFLVSTLFLVFLVCRLRPASYSWVDTFVLTTGMLAILFLPASFLHFFLIFPKPVRLRPALNDPAYRRKRRVWVATLIAIYLIPPAVLFGSSLAAKSRGVDLPLISGAPIANWWLLAIYMVLGLTALAINSRRLANARQRRGAALVFLGSLFGLLPFMVVAAFFPSLLHTDQRFLLFGVGPLILVPLSFAYAIVRFQFLDIRVILRKSLLYTATTAVVTAFYALGIALFNGFTRGTDLAASRFFPIVFALVIVLLFEPLRQRMQILVDRFFRAEQTRLQEAQREMGEAFSARGDLQQVVRDLVDRLPQLLGLHFAALYLARDGKLDRMAGPSVLPETLPWLPELHEILAFRGGLARLDRIRFGSHDSAALAETTGALGGAGVKVVGDLSTPRRQVGLVLLSGKIGQLSLDRDDFDLLRNLLQQAAIALETSLLLEERTEQAELERELEIAATVQNDLLPAQLSFGPGWSVAAVCRPARHIGGDFYTELPGPDDGSRAIVYGDVAGKSVSGALVMMAAHEVLHSLALTHQNPEELLGLANQRLYGLGRRKSFVALAYLVPNGSGLDYLLAGQPQPLLRRATGGVSELELPDYRLPLGAMTDCAYRVRNTPMSAGDLVVGYSDGVVDARSPDGETFGTERLLEVVENSPADAHRMIGSILKAVDRFTQGGEPYDDITLVAIGRGAEAGE